jgi:hypothetical protein
VSSRGHTVEILHRGGNDVRIWYDNVELINVFHVSATVELNEPIEVTIKLRNVKVNWLTQPPDGKGVQGARTVEPNT